MVIDPMLFNGSQNCSLAFLRTFLFSQVSSLHPRVIFDQYLGFYTFSDQFRTIRPKLLKQRSPQRCDNFFLCGAWALRHNWNSAAALVMSGSGAAVLVMAPRPPGSTIFASIFQRCGFGKVASRRYCCSPVLRHFSLCFFLSPPQHLLAINYHIFHN